MTPTPESVKRYPLEWPLGWPRKRTRRHGTFKTYSKYLNTTEAPRRLEVELRRLGVTSDATLSTNVRVNMSGAPYGNENPGDPGVAVYFVFKKKPMVLACDSFYKVADNIAAIAGHVEALRRIERYGVGSIEQAMAGYKSLPADTAAEWWHVLGVPRTATLDAVDTAYKALAREKHPDIARDDGAAMAHLNRAREYAVAELKGD